MAYKTTSNNILSWAEEDRPREKLIQKGKSVLTNAELIAILIGSGNRSQSAVDLSKEILNFSNNKINELAKLDIKSLTKFNGIGEAKAITIVAALEIGRRRLGESVDKTVKIASSSDVYDLMKPNLLDLKVEEFWILLMNKANVVMKKLSISSGGVAGTVVDPKLVFKPALEELASSIILVHNHPSGNLKPSKADIDITNKLVVAGKVLETPIIDHLIFSNNGYYSFADEGLI